MATTVLASIGDHGALNASLSPAIAETWIDRDLSWLDFNDRVLAEALDEGQREKEEDGPDEWLRRIGAGRQVCRRRCDYGLPDPALHGDDDGAGANGGEWGAGRRVYRGR